MTRAVIGRRYARALVELARGKGVEQQEALEKDFGLVVEELRSNEDLRRIVLHRLVTPTEKFRVMSAIFGGKVSPVLIQFIHLVFEKRRERWLEEIYRQYVTYLDLMRNVAEAELLTAGEVEDESAKELARKLERLTGMKVKLTVKEDPSLIAGVILKFGDKVYDGSLRGRLLSLMNEMRKRG